MATECFYCHRPVSDKAKFCGPCGTNIRCTNKECGQDLEVDDVRCSECGKSVESRPITVENNTAKPTMNTFEFHEDRNSRSFKGAFTDVVGESGLQALAALLDKSGSKTPQPRIIKAPSAQRDLFEEEARIADDDVPKQPQLPVARLQQEPTNGSVDKQRLQDLFYLNEDGWTLENNDLKAKSKIDFVRRVTCLFLYYKKEVHAQDLVPRSELRGILNHCDVNDGNARKWFSLPDGAGALMHASDNDLRLKPPGREEAKNYLQDVYNPELASIYRPGKKGKRMSGKKDGGIDDNTEME